MIVHAIHGFNPFSFYPFFQALSYAGRYPGDIAAKGGNLLHRARRMKEYYASHEDRFDLRVEVVVHGCHLNSNSKSETARSPLTMAMAPRRWAYSQRDLRSVRTRRCLSGPKLPAASPASSTVNKTFSRIGQNNHVNAIEQISSPGNNVYMPVSNRIKASRHTAIFKTTIRPLRGQKG